MLQEQQVVRVVGQERCTTLLVSRCSPGIRHAQAWRHTSGVCVASSRSPSGESQPQAARWPAGKVMSQSLNSAGVALFAQILWVRTLLLMRFAA